MTVSRTFLVLGALFLILGGIAFYASHKTAQAPNAPVITETVTTTVDPSSLTYSNASLSFQYPAALPSTYIHPVDWPPKVSVSDEVSPCVEATTIINDREYCVITTSEGAAGSIYIDYVYAFKKEGKTILLTFTLRQVQCANYDDPETTVCEQERNSFDVHALADSIVQTAELK